MLEEKQTKPIWICHMICSQESNIEKKRLENRANYSQLVFEIRERTPGFKVIIVSLVITLAFGGSLKEILKELENMFEKDDLCELTLLELSKTILMDSETIIWKVLSGLFRSN